MTSLRAQVACATFIRGFDPSTGTDASSSIRCRAADRVIFQQLIDGTDAFVTMAESFAADDWDAPGEAPFGHLPRDCPGYAFWDPAPRRDILEPLGLAPRSSPTSCRDLIHARRRRCKAACSTMPRRWARSRGAHRRHPAVQGAPGRCCDQDRHRRAHRADGGDTFSAGAAVDVVESLAGRNAPAALAALPDDLSAQLGRAAQIL
jgi:hypothetical protein